jgi:methylglutamate dehydrogenase subunit B
MIITCPYCGPRDLSEFAYQGDGNRTRPDQTSIDQNAWNAYVYDRINPAGEHNEIWQHAGGCRSHLAVKRNTLTHVISKVAFAGTTAAKKPASRRKPRQKT